MQEEPLPLRDLIKEVRACKTAAEERAVIGQESAKIRNSFRDDRCAFRHRSVTKLLFIQMMGYQTHFGQVECLKLIASQDFTEKRVGYLGLTQLLNDKDDVLMMVTNHVQQDMQSSNNQVSALALTALANVGTADMCRDLAKNVETLLLHSNSFIRKKANLAAVRVIRKCPELNEDFARHLSSILEDRNHGVLLTAVTLMLEICKVNPDQVRDFRQFTQILTRSLKNLLLSGYSPEHDISGITDPFLQVALLRMLRLLGHKDRQASEEMNDTLAQLATNTECTKNTGNSILYECVKVILDIEASSGLRVLAVNIMGRFLLNRDNNIRYVALNTLHRLVTLDANAVQRHKTTITECLRDQDGVIRRKALDLTIAITNEANIKTIVKELLDYLLTAEADFKDVLVSKVCLVVERFSPNKKWHIDTIIRVLTLAGRFVPEESIATAAHLMAATPELQTYSVHKLYHAVKENTGSAGLVQLAVWAMGEFGTSLVQQTVQGPDGVESSVGEVELCEYLGEILASRPADITRQYVLTALIKLTVRIPGARARLLDLISGETTAMSVEIQQRACEYLKLLDGYWDRVRGGLLEPIPSLRLEKGEGQPVADDEEGSKSPLNPPKALAKNMLDIDLLLGTDEPSPAQPTEERPAPTATPTLDDIFGSSTPILNAFQSPPEAPAQPSDPTDALTLTPIQDEDIVVTMSCTKKDSGNPEITTIEASTRNVSTSLISAFKLQVAVPKHVQLQLSPASSTTMASGEQVVQTIRLTNSLQGEKALMMKLKCDFQLGPEPRSKQTTVSSFPASY